MVIHFYLLDILSNSMVVVYTLKFSGMFGNDLFLPFFIIINLFGKFQDLWKVVNPNKQK